MGIKHERGFISVFHRKKDMIASADFNVFPGETEQLVEPCKRELGSMKTPKSFEFREDLPRSAVGKVLKREIRSKYWKGQWRAV